MLENIKADTRRLRCFKTKSFPWYVLESLAFETGYQAVVLYRIASWFKRHRVPLFGPLIARISQFLTAVDIAPGADIGPGLLISHGTGIVIGESARLGADATLLHAVTIGALDTNRLAQMPQIGDRAFIGAGAVLVGSIEIGNDVIIGTNVVLTEDVPDNSRVVAGQSLRIAERSGDYQPIEFGPPTRGS